ncbi:MAG: hypothetical protein Tsb0017_25190 [Geothermobacteraceae bacterium]
MNNARQALNEKYPSEHPQKRIEIGVSEDDHLARITLTDFGPGISEAIRDKIFAPFFTTKPAGSGTGLGLSISASIIQQHGGHLSIDSVVGEYTRLEVFFPLVHGETEQGQTPVSSSS